MGVLRSLFIVELKVLVLDGSLHSLWSHPGHLVFTKENNTLCKYRGRRDTMGLSDIYQKTEDRRRWKGGPTLLVPLSLVRARLHLSWRIHIASEILH